MDRKKLFAKAHAALASQDLSTARPLCAQLLGRFPNDAAVLELNSSLFLELGEAGKALKLLRQASTLGPGNPSRSVLVARVLVEVGDERAAWRELQQALAKFPDDFGLRIAAGRLAFELGEAELALPQFLAAERLGSLGAPSFLMAARSLAALGREQEGKSYLARSIATHSDGEAMTLLGFILQAEGDFAAARAHFWTAIQTEPNRAAAYLGYAQGLAFSEADRGFLDSVSSLLASDHLTQSDRMTLEYVAGKGREDLGEFDAAFAHYVRGNELAFDLNLKGRPFDREGHTRYLDETFRHFSPSVLSGSFDHPPTSVRPIFVVGMMRSGTTLLEQILSSHPQIAGGGELDFWPDHHRSSFDLTAIPELRSAYSDLLHARFPSSWVVDKMPQNYQSLGPIHLAFPEAPIIHVRRDPLDTCLSIYTTAYSHSPEFAHDLSSIRFVYEKYLEAMSYWRSNLPYGRMIEVSYEDLVSDREPVLREIFSRIDLEWNDSVLSHEKNQRLVTTPSVWQVRQPIYSGSVHRSKRFESHLGPWIGLA